MFNNKDYSNLTLEELLIEEKKIKKEITISAFITGFLIGVIVYGVVKNGFGFIYIFIPAILIYLNHRNSENTKQNLKKIQSELQNKGVK